jgi:high-affinity nickel-transport protein
LIAQAHRLIGIYVLLLVGNACAWLWAWSLFANHTVLIGTAALAYALGLRHAVDADHIVAIDNVTRKLMQNGQMPLTVGLYFSLGHSTVVVAACGVMSIAAVDLYTRFAAMREMSELIGTGISAFFLLAVALANFVTLASVWRVFRARTGEVAPAPSGLLSRVMRPIMGAIAKPSQMYPLGFLFGLGFDTASEVALLGVSASAASHELPSWNILVFPALFAAGMTLIDTTEGLLMRGAYGWALIKPQRRLAYNLVITLFSIIAALIIGGLEVLNLIANGFVWTGAFWRWIGNLCGHFGAIGCFIIVGPVAYWLLAVLLSRGGKQLAKD